MIQEYTIPLVQHVSQAQPSSDKHSSYLVSTLELGKIRELFSEKKSINSNDFQLFCSKGSKHHQLESTDSKKFLTELFNSLESNGSLDFDSFLIAYAFARSSDMKFLIE